MKCFRIFIKKQNGGYRKKKMATSTESEEYWIYTKWLPFIQHPLKGVRWIYVWVWVCAKFVFWICIRIPIPSSSSLSLFTSFLHLHLKFAILYSQFLWMYCCEWVSIFEFWIFSLRICILWVCVRDLTVIDRMLNKKNEFSLSLFGKQSFWVEFSWKTFAKNFHQPITVNDGFERVKGCWQKGCSGFSL